MAFSSSKVEAPQITGSLFGTASWAVSASWAPSNGASQGVAYQTAQSGTLFDVTIAYPGSGPAESRSIGGALQPGDVSVLYQQVVPMSSISESINMVYRLASTASIAPEMGGTGQPRSRMNGLGWVPILTYADMIAFTFLPAASSSVEGLIPGAIYHSGSATTGSIYYATNLQKYRVYKGLGNGGWQDLVQSSGGGAFPFTGSAAVSGTFQLDSTGSQANKFATSSMFGSQPIQASAAFGSNNEISASQAFAFGVGNKIAGVQSMAAGGGNLIGQYSGVSFAAGSSNLITASVIPGVGGGGAQVAMGYRATSSAVIATAIGTAVHAAGTSSFAQGGLYTRSGSLGGGNTEILASGGLALGGGSHAEGLYTTAIGVGSHAEGGGFIQPLSGSWSSLVGIQGGVAIGSGSHAEGRETTAIGNWSHTQGLDTVALGDYQLVAGQWNELIPSKSAFIVGDGTSDSARHNLLYASGGRVDISGSLYVNGSPVGGVAGNLQTITTAGNTTSASVLILSSFAQGTQVTASGNFSHAEGSLTLASQQFSHAEGRETTTFGFGSHAEGFETTTTTAGNYAHAEGQTSKAAGNYSHAEGNNTTSIGEASHAEGTSTQAIGRYSHAEGSITIAVADWSHAEGNSTTAIGGYSHAEGQNTRAIGANSHAEGQQSWASGSYSHCEGQLTTAAGTHSHTMGYSTVAVGSYSNAEGFDTIARGPYAHSEGANTDAWGTGSHAEGDNTTAVGDYSHTSGKHTIAGAGHQFVVGMFNQTSTESGSFIVGAGSSNGARKNVLFASGSVVQVTGSLLIQSASVNGEAVSNIGDTFTGTAKVTKMVTCTSAEYAAIGTKDPNTFYIVI
jgi:hypothetical protein